MSVSLHPRGTILARTAIARVIAQHEGSDAATVAERAWGAASPPALAIRAAVAAAGTDDLSSAALAPLRTAGEEFIAAMRPASILGKMSGYRRVPANVLVPRATSGSGVAWVGAKSSAPLSAMAFDNITLKPLKISGIVTCTQELALLSTPRAESIIRDDLIAAAATFTDGALIDPAAAGEDGVSPASITRNAASIASTGTTTAAMGEDLRRLFRLVLDQGVDMRQPYLITSPRVCVGLALTSDLSGGPAFPGVSVRGGELAGVPLIVSSSVPATPSGNSPAGDYSSSIILVDAAELIVADDGAATISMARHATLQMDSSPDSPVTGSTVEVSLWQRNLAAWKVTLPLNFVMRRPEAVAILTGVNY